MPALNGALDKESRMLCVKISLGGEEMDAVCINNSALAIGKKLMPIEILDRFKIKILFYYPSECDGLYVTDFRPSQAFLANLAMAIDADVAKSRDEAKSR